MGGRLGWWWVCLSSPRCGWGGCRGGGRAGWSPRAAVPRAPPAAPLHAGIPGWGWRPPRRAHPGAQGRWVTSRALSTLGGSSQGQDLGLGWLGSMSGGGMSVNPASHPSPWRGPSQMGHVWGARMLWEGGRGKERTANRVSAQSPRSRAHGARGERMAWLTAVPQIPGETKHSLPPAAGSMAPCLQTLL